MNWKYDWTLSRARTTRQSSIQKTMWLRFATRAKKKFADKMDLSWERVGKAVMLRLGNIEAGVVTWPLGTKKLDLNQLVVLTHEQAMRRPRRVSNPVVLLS